MESSMELKDSMCRICLDQKAILNWYDEILELSGVTYKDCYYKYTQLEILVKDPYSQMLCQTCSADLKTSHILITKALESHVILQQTYPAETQFICNESEETKVNIETFTDQKYEPKSEPDEFEMLILKQSEELSIVGESNDENEFLPLSDDGTNSYNTPPPEKRKKRSYKKSKDKDSKTNKTKSQEDISNKSKSKIQKPLTDDKCDDKEFDSDNEPLKNLRKCKQKSKVKVAKVKKSVNKVSDESPNIPEIPKEKKEKKIYTYEKKKLMCSICSKIYSGKTSLLRHEESHNEQRERLDVCPHCGIKFFNKRCLYLHLKIHNKDREKKHKCEFCNKAYYNMGALNVHKRMHLGQMVPCPICAKEFHRQVDLDRHNMVAHSEVPLHTDVKKKSKYYVFCKDCNKHLLTTSWKAHQAAHLKEPLMKCSICVKDFFNRDTCRYHMQKTHNYKTREEYEPYIIYCKPNRLSHLLLEQHDIIEPVKS